MKEEGYKNFFEENPLPMLVTDENGMILDVNKAAIQLYGYSKSSLLKKDLSALSDVVNVTSLASGYGIQKDKKGNRFSVIMRSGKINYPNKKALLYCIVVIEQYPRDSVEQQEISLIEEDRSEAELKVIILNEQRALKAAEITKDKLAFLAEASEILSSTLDYKQTLKTVARLATPKLSDWCVVDILDENDDLSRLAVSHINPDKIKLAYNLHKKYGPSKDETSGVYQVLRTGIAEFYPEIPEELIRAGARDEEHLRISLELGLKSGMIVPLKTRDKVFGTLTLIYAESGRRYSESDLHFVEELARRAALAIDNAKLYSQAQLLNKELDQKILDLKKEISSRKQVESILIDNQEQLMLSEERLKAALTASETGTYRWNMDKNTMYFDDNLLHLFGLPPGAGISLEEYQNIVHPADREKLIKELDRCVKENDDFELEYRVVWNDGTVRWIMDKGKIFSIEEGKPLFMTGACVDITYRKHAEQTLRDSEVLFRQIAENIRDIFFILNPVNKNIIYISPLFEEVWGIKREDIYRNPDIYVSSIHPDDYENYFNLFNEGLKTGRFTIEYRIIRPDNTIRWLRSRGFPLYNEKKELYRITGLTEDITERKAAEEELHKNQELLRSTVTSAPIIIWGVNNNKEITLLEGKGLTKAGWNSEDYLGQNIYHLFKDNEEVINYLDEAFSGKEVSFTLQAYDSWLEIRYSPLRDNSGAILGIIGVSLDITGHKEAEEKIISSLKEKEILLKEIHHRVKNNLQIISSILSLQADYIQQPALQVVLEESKNRIRSMSLLHEKLYQTKDFSKIDFRSYLEDLVLNLFSSYRIEEEKIVFFISGDNINIDSEKAISIGLIINELISNSLKYAFNGAGKGEININYYCTDGNILKLLISDNGRGLPEDFNIQNTETLGLQLINSLVDQLDGQISVYSDNGAFFEISLPDIAQ